MKILAIETSAKSVSAAVVEGGVPLASAYQNRGLTHSRTLMPMAETSARISVMGQRMAIRIIIWKVFCNVATSEVSRVTMEAVENLSILEKLKSCT